VWASTDKHRLSRTGKIGQEFEPKGLRCIDHVRQHGITQIQNLRDNDITNPDSEKEVIVV
jgi:hypothetical protein